MMTLQIVWLALALTGRALAVFDARIFKKEKALENLVFLDYRVFTSTSDSKLECGSICLYDKSCASFTYIQSAHTPGTCHGYFRPDLEHASTTSAAGASTYVVKSVKCAACTNVAVKKPATQHSTSYNGYPGRAVDNNFNTHYQHGRSCSHTSPSRAGKEAHWWQVNLQKSYNIFSVSITTRRDATSSNRDFDIHVSKEDPTHPGAKSILCYHHVGATKRGKTENFNCYRNPIRGQIVRITNKPWRGLVLCEVQVMALSSQ